MTTLEIKELSVQFAERPVLSKLNLTFKENEFVAIVGPSGSGKSTFLKTLIQVVQAQSGEILLDNQPLDDKKSAFFSYMPQQDLLFDWLDIYQNVILYQKINHLPVDRKKVQALFVKFGLADVQHHFPRALSGGMRQRAALMRTLMNPAPFLLLDEPFGALDAMTRSLMQDWFLEIRATLPQTICLVTHDIEEAIYLADRIVVFSNRPARVRQSFSLNPKVRNREWLATCGPLKNEIYQLLRSESHVE